MLHVHHFVFNPYQENTYIIYNDEGECIIIDPGMSTAREEEELVLFIEKNNLRPVKLLNTHCHVDHVLGNHFIASTYQLVPAFHEGEIPVLVEVQNYAPQMGFRYDVSPIPLEFLDDNSIVRLGEYELFCILAPGHSPAHLCFYSSQFNFLIGGDVLFRNSIGRTDLPGGNHAQLLNSIKSRIYSLPNETVVYPGHGPTTTIGYEKENNPFIRG